MPRRKSNRRLLIDRLFEGYVDRVKPRDRAKDPNPVTADKVKTAHLQSMAALFGDELTALSAGAVECRQHPNQVDGVCPRCRNLWPDHEQDQGEEVEEEEGDEDDS